MIKCPNCDSLLVKTKGKAWRLKTGFIFALVGFILIYACDSFLLIVLAVPFMLAAIVRFIGALIFSTTRTVCRQCGFDFELHE